MSIHTGKAHLLEYLWKAAIETDQEIQSKFVQDFKWIYTDIFLQYSLTISHVAVIPAVHTYNWVRLPTVKLLFGRFISSEVSEWAEIFNTEFPAWRATVWVHPLTLPPLFPLQTIAISSAVNLFYSSNTLMEKNREEEGWLRGGSKNFKHWSGEAPCSL